VNNCKFGGVDSVPVAFVLINAKIDAMEKVLKALENVESVKEAYSVFGVYDVVVKVEADSMDKIKDLVTYRIRKLDGVNSSLTMIVIE
jgi:DNA-binding Lrp family transcriptional regulator